MKATPFRFTAFAAVLVFLAGTVLSAEAARRTGSRTAPPPPVIIVDAPVVSPA